MFAFDRCKRFVGPVLALSLSRLFLASARRSVAWQHERQIRTNVSFCLWQLAFTFVTVQCCKSVDCIVSNLKRALTNSSTLCIYLKARNKLHIFLQVIRAELLPLEQHKWNQQRHHRGRPRWHLKTLNQQIYQQILVRTKTENRAAIIQSLSIVVVFGIKSSLHNQIT